MKAAVVTQAIQMGAFNVNEIASLERLEHAIVTGVSLNTICDALFQDVLGFSPKECVRIVRGVEMPYSVECGFIHIDVYFSEVVSQPWHLSWRITHQNILFGNDGYSLFDPTLDEVLSLARYKRDSQFWYQVYPVHIQKANESIAGLYNLLRLMSPVYGGEDMRKASMWLGKFLKKCTHNDLPKIEYGAAVALKECSEALYMKQSVNIYKKFMYTFKKGFDNYGAPQEVKNLPAGLSVGFEPSLFKGVYDRAIGV